MLDSDNFVKAGWVHGLRLHSFAEAKFLIMGKVMVLAMLLDAGAEIALSLF